MKKNLIKIFFIILLLFLYNETFAETTTYSPKNWYEKYKEEVDRFCKVNFDNSSLSSEKIMILDETKYFKDLSKDKSIFAKDFLAEAKKDYEKNMDSIYDCALLSSNFRALDTVKTKFISKNAKLNTKLKKILEQKLNQLKTEAKKLWKCTVKEKIPGSALKMSVLNQVTYETCKYDAYLDYLSDFSDNVTSNTDKKAKKDISVKDLNDKVANRKQKIAEEKQRAYKAFPTVYKAFSDYESNITNHIYLELLKEDYKIFRVWLHKTLNPINQVIYKINNAMKK